MLPCSDQGEQLHKEQSWGRFLSLVVKTPTWAADPQIHIPVDARLADLQILAVPRGITFVIGGRRVGGNLSHFLHHKKFQPKLHKESWQHFFSDFRGFLWKVAISPNVLLISPYARVFNRLCSAALLHHNTKLGWMGFLHHEMQLHHFLYIPVLLYSLMFSFCSLI